MIYKKNQKTGQLKIRRGQLLSPFIKEIEIFFIIYECKSISRASEALSMDQGNVSRSLKKFEKLIGKKLFIRFKNGLKPTVESETLYKKLKNMSETWSNYEINDEQKKRLRIGLHESIAKSYLPVIMSYLKKQHTELDVEVSFHNSIDVTRKIINRELELGLVANPIKSKDLVLREFKKESIELCCKRDISENTTLLKNPQMLFLKTNLNKVNFNKVIQMNDYDVMASICEFDSNFACIIPSEVLKRSNKLNSILKIKDKISIKLVTYPGSTAIGILSELKKLKY